MSTDARLVIRGTPEPVVQHLKMLAIREGVTLSELATRVLSAYVTANPIPKTDTKA